MAVERSRDSFSNVRRLNHSQIHSLCRPGRVHDNSSKDTSLNTTILLLSHPGVLGFM